jgi:sortase A
VTLAVRLQRLRRWGVVAVLVALAIVMSGTVHPLLRPARAADAATPYTITKTSPFTDLSDGQRVTVNVKSGPDTTIREVEVHQCRLEATYEKRSDVLKNAGNCPPSPVSSSGDTVVVRTSSNGVGPATQSAQGATLTFRAGLGVVEWKAAGGADARLECDPNHACAIVVAVLIGEDYTFTVLPITFRISDVIAGCGGPAEGVFSSAGSDAISELYANWTLDACQQDGAHGAASRAVLSGEGPAVDGFSGGVADLAYTAAGYDDSFGFGPLDKTLRRPAVMIPVAITAATLSAGGGYTQSTGDKSAYSVLQVAAREAAAMFTGGYGWFIEGGNTYDDDLLARNPQLNGRVNAEVPTNKPMAPAEGEASSYLFSKYFLTQVPAEWKIPHDGTPRSAANSWATAQPTFDSIDLYSGRSILSKVTDQAANSQSSQGPIWAITDLATSFRLALTPASIQNAKGDFVAPTKESMLAAVKAMKKNDQGVLLPDVAATTTSGVQPYPLTYVVYAMAPAEPLLEDDCSARPTSQALLKDWLGYLLGRGQDHMADGFVPLPSDLLADAKQQVKLVGEAKVTGACAVPEATTTATTIPGSDPTPASSADVPRSAGAPVVSASSRSNALAHALTAPEPTTPQPVETAVERITRSVPIPGFVNVKSLGWFGVLFGIAGVVAITAFAAFAAAQRSARITRPLEFATAIGLWVGAALVLLPLVVYQLGPVAHERSQHSMLRDFRASVRQSANEASGLGGVSVPTKAPEPGSSVAIVEIGSLQARQVAVEGVSPDDTRRGPGHVPGTAGLGQPGNSVVVARRTAFGGSLGRLDALQKGNKILVTTTQGQSVYVVTALTKRNLASESARDDVYGKTTKDMLTIVTSGSRTPWNSSLATVVRARLATEPFAPTPQGGRTDANTGRSGAAGAWAATVLAIAAFAMTAAGSVVVYKRMQPRIAYVLTLGPLAALAIVMSESIVRLLPAWS